MKLELLLVAFFAAVVPGALGQMDPASMMSMLGMDVKLPPKPPKSLFPQYYVSREQLVARARQLRYQQEMALFKRLKTMSQKDIAAFRARLTPTQLQQLVARLKYLKAQEERQQGAAGSTTTTTQQQQPPTTTGGPNMVLSGANKIRRPSSSTAASRRLQRIRALVAAARRRSQNSPMAALRKYQSYRKKAMNAIAAGCTYPGPMESTMDSFFAFSSGGCKTGAFVCAASMQSCVDIAGSIMCCPVGYTSGTLDMVQYMDQMQQFMAQF